MTCKYCGASHHHLFCPRDSSETPSTHYYKLPSPEKFSANAFDGATYEPSLDYKRLKTGLERVRWIMTHPTGFWWSLAELSSKADVPLNSVSSRVRDLRKAKNGSLHVESRRVRGGLWEYRVISTEEMALRELAGTG